MDDAHASGGPPMLVADGARTPTHGERSRTLLAANRDGVLSTIALDPEGHPFGSLATYALDERGRPLVLMSTMAEHARNLAADPRASLLVAASGDGAGRLAAARATLVGSLQPVDDAEQEEATAAYREAHPDAFWADFDDFFTARLEIAAIRYVRGFGEMSWVDVAGFRDAAPDPIAAAEAAIVGHMNDDHADALAEIVTHELGVIEVEDVEMLSCDRYGFEVRLERTGQGLAFGRIGFAEALDEPDQARGAMVALTRRARGD